MYSFSYHLNSLTRQNEYEVHLLSMTTGEQHPAVEISPLVYRSNRTPVQYELLVYEDKLGILFVSNQGGKAASGGVPNLH